jgi:hypothetical protein
VDERGRKRPAIALIHSSCASAAAAQREAASDSRCRNQCHHCDSGRRRGTMWFGAAGFRKSNATYGAYARHSGITVKVPPNLISSIKVLVYLSRFIRSNCVFPALDNLATGISSRNNQEMHSLSDA